MTRLSSITSLFAMIFMVSCTTDTVDDSYKNAFDCEFENTPNFIGICLNGSQVAFPNETLTYASKATSNFTEILWEIETGGIEILNIENSFENNLPRSIATLRFSSNFSGGSIKVTAINDSNNSVAEISEYGINLEN